jgi:hypothetical protein
MYYVLRRNDKEEFDARKRSNASAWYNFYRKILLFLLYLSLADD